MVNTSDLLSANSRSRAYAKDAQQPLPWESETLIGSGCNTVWTSPETSRRDRSRNQPEQGARRDSQGFPSCHATVNDILAHLAPNSNSQRRSKMSRITSSVVPALKILALLAAIAVALGSIPIKERAGEALFAAWRELGDRLVKDELSAIAQQLELEREDAKKIRASRDDVAMQLVALQAQRELATAEAHERGTRSRDGSARELAALDRTISVLKSTANRADRILRDADDTWRGRQIELSILQADVNARRLNQAIARPIGEPALWSSHLGRARVVLGLDSVDHADCYTAFELASDPIAQE